MKRFLSSSKSRVMVSTWKSTEGIDCGVVDLFRVKPIDKRLLSVLQKYHSLVTIEEQCLSGGFGSSVLEAISDSGLQIPVKRLGLEKKYYFENGGREHLLDQAGLSTINIGRVIKELSC